MDHFQYRDGVLAAEDVSLTALADTTGTPFYCYSAATLERHYTVFADAFADMDATVCYAVKANNNIAVIATLAQRGAGADVVSGGELKRALVAGVAPEKIVYSGVGKQADEMAAALKAGILQINVESEPELELLNQVAGEVGVKAPVAIRINPDVDAQTHAKITTGKAENKFGIEWTRAHEVYGKAHAMEHIDLKGVAVHIGSQLLDLTPYREAYLRLRDLVAILRADGLTIESLDLGGGLGIPYDDTPSPDPEAYADVVRDAVGDLGCRLILEPGRMIAGNAGILVTRVLFVKKGATRTFVIVDAAMNDLMRPALYDAYHKIVTVDEPTSDRKMVDVDVVGPICESGDTFAVQRSLPELKAGDLLAIRTVGAYGAVMASGYNARSLPAEVLVRGDNAEVVRQRITVDDMLDREKLPPWLSNA